MDSINNYTQHQLNTSVSKAAFQFPKQRRFNYRTRFITESFYDIPSTKEARTTSFGYGTKDPFPAKSQSPPPGSYNLSSSFQKDKSGMSFGKGRQNVKFGSFLSASKDKKFLPSPDKYKIPTKFSTVGGKMFARLPTELDSLHKKKTPGPGTYDPQGVNIANSGSYVLSQMKNQSSPRLHSCTVTFDKTQRKKNFSELSPVTYNPVEKDNSKYFNSKYKSSLARTFGREQRVGPEDKSKRYVPSFKYKRFSQFGTLI